MWAATGKHTEIIGHHVPEVEILIHLTNEQLLVVLGTTWSSDLRRHFIRTCKISNIYVTHCQRILVANSFTFGMGVQTLPEFFQQFYVSPSLFRTPWILVIDIKSVKIINQ